MSVLINNVKGEHFIGASRESDELDLLAANRCALRSEWSPRLNSPLIPVEYNCDYLLAMTTAAY
jgi:hypothetical protein